MRCLTYFPHIFTPLRLFLTLHVYCFMATTSTHL